MTPTHPSVSDDPKATSAADELQRRRRRDSLLNLRRSLAVLATERRAHQLDDAWETFDQQLAVEAVIAQDFPRVYRQQLADWATLDNLLDHDPARLSPDCGICRAIADRSGINVEPPAAA
jgi:hypothetical protein